MLSFPAQGYDFAFWIHVADVPSKVDCLSKSACCREGICGSCAMNINGTNGLACLTKVSAHCPSRCPCLMQTGAPNTESQHARMQRILALPPPRWHRLVSAPDSLWGVSIALCPVLLWQGPCSQLCALGWCAAGRPLPAAELALRSANARLKAGMIWLQVERDAGKVTKVAPLPHMFVVKDLVVDMSNFYAQYKSINPFLQKRENP